MSRLYQLLIFSCFTLLSNPKYPSTKGLNKGSSYYNNIVSDQGLSIIILPLGKNLPKSFINATYSKLKQFIPGITIGESTSFPISAYYKPRGRYRADSLINWMGKKAQPNQVYLGITNVDISTTKNGKADWGVLGLGFCPGNAAVASSYRLKNKSSFWKVAIHELGHTSGLPHCPEKTCFMRDAEGKNTTGEEKEFCKKCKAFLIRSGWKL
ncbi:MAG: Zn-dependent protease [Chitinophagaceae bacterium]|nr:Zn-dependent protease [Chitinophagaceae bacterium]